MRQGQDRAACACGEHGPTRVPGIGELPGVSFPDLRQAEQRAVTGRAGEGTATQGSSGPALGSCTQEFTVERSWEV